MTSRPPPGPSHSPLCCIPPPPAPVAWAPPEGTRSAAPSWHSRARSAEQPGAGSRGAAWRLPMEPLHGPPRTGLCPGLPADVSPPLCALGALGPASCSASPAPAPALVLPGQCVNAPQASGQAGRTFPHSAFLEGGGRGGQGADWPELRTSPSDPIWRVWFFLFGQAPNPPSMSPPPQTSTSQWDSPTPAPQCPAQPPTLPLVAFLTSLGFWGGSGVLSAKERGESEEVRPRARQGQWSL